MIEKINLNQEDLDILRELSGRKILLKNTVTQNKESIISLQKQGLENALEYLDRKRRGHNLSLYEENNLYGALLDIQKKLGLFEIPRKIECFDITHLSGKFAYGSMVTFIDGKPAKKLYRLFKVPDRNNDFENMKEMLIRRFIRSLSIQENEAKNSNQDSQENIKNLEKNRGWILPDLIVIDGGKGQLSSVLKAWNEFLNDNFKMGELEKVRKQTFICALAKKEERVFFKVGEDFDSILFDGFTKFLIQRLRDETHRFGITHNRKARLRTISKSALEEIDGIGPQTKEKLLKEFGSLQEVVETLWNKEFLIQKSVGGVITKKLKAHFGIGK